jgi:hypothetical protein
LSVWDRCRCLLLLLVASYTSLHVLAQLIAACQHAFGWGALQTLAGGAVATVGGTVGIYIMEARGKDVLDQWREARDHRQP